jgi:RHS repeat-associated protein
MNHRSLAVRALQFLSDLSFRTTRQLGQPAATHSKRVMLPLATILLAVLASSAAAQSAPGPNVRTAAGSPTGSYPIDNLESINYFNGRVHFELPLLNIEGRGDAQQSVMLTIDPALPSAGKGCPGCPNYFQLSAAIWDYEVGYGPGVLEAVVEGQEMSTFECQFGIGSDFNDPTRTFLRFKGGDGTEYSLYDVVNDGRVMPNNSPCITDPHAAFRGRVFVTKDGSAVTFISDVDIFDNRFGSGPNARYFPSGVLKLRDGTRYRIDNGVVTTLTDRNGNKIVYEYYAPVSPIFPLPASSFPGRVKKITDSLGRQVQFTYDNPTGVATERFDELSYTGFANQPRTIRVYYERLEHALRANETIQTYCQLGLDCETPNAGVLANPLVVSSVVMPNGRSYQFSYDKYAELARYELPTGGAIEFDYDWGMHLSVFSSDTYRRVVQRRTYPNGGTGSSYEGKTTYSKPESAINLGSYYGGSSVGFIDVDHIGRPNGFDILLSRERHYYFGIAGAPAWTSNAPGFFSPPAVHDVTDLRYLSWKHGREYKTEYLGSDGATVLRRTEFEWRQSATPSWWNISPDFAPENNPRLVETITMLTDVSPNLVSKQTSINPYIANVVGFDQYNNQTDVWEYDFGPGAPGALLRHTHTDYVTAANYTDAQTGAHLRNLVQLSTILDSIENVVSQTAISYDEPAFPLLTYFNVFGWTDPGTTARGNATTVKQWLNTNNSFLQSHTQFDQLGNARKLWEPRDTTLNNPTQIDYSVTYQFAFPTLNTSPDPDRTANTNGPRTPLTTSLTYDFSTGLTTSTTDPNNVTSTVEYNDPLERPTRTISGANTSIQNQTTINYDDASHLITTTSDQDFFNDNVLMSQMDYDGFGRTIETRAFEGGMSYIARQTQYDALGRPYRNSNPFRPFEVILWKTTSFDALGRVTSEMTSDNAAVNTFYSGNRILSKDQLGKARLSQMDGVGRVANVWEITSADDQTESVSFPNRPEISAGYRTGYAYDPLSNLTTVTQRKGTTGSIQTRSFTYDSLSRLRTAINPESGSVTYGYDDNGNLNSKSDARGVSTIYAYDSLNRVTSRSYNDGTPSVSYAYDTVAQNGKGRLALISSLASDYSYSSYDALGRVLAGSQIIHGQLNRTYSMSYSYDLAGHMKTMTYPSGRVVSNTYDSAGRLFSVSGNLGDGNFRTYSNGMNYSTFGGMSQEQLGTTTPIFNKWIYNSRGQLAEIREGLTPFNTTWERGGIINYYSDSCAGSCGGSTSPATMTDNNGNLKKQEHWIPDANGIVTAIPTQKFEYDNLNRLQRTYEGVSSQPSWQQRYVYDRFGNRTIDQANTSPGFNSTPFDRNEAASTNRLYAPGDTSLPMAQRRMQYDGVGNLIFDSYTGQGTRIYDAENRTTLAVGNGQSQSYSYDGEGRRVKRTVNGVETWQVYAIDGELIAEYAASGSVPQREYGYRNGQLLITTAVTAGSSWGPLPVFSDNPLNPNFVGQTTIRASHISQLRTAINSVRSNLNLTPYSWQFSANAGDFISANPIIEMRTALDQALGAPAGGYASGLAIGQRVKAIHIQELRDRVLSSWDTGGSSVLDIRWVVADQLGTPRIIFDQSGSLANTGRHEYLPFGEELFAGAAAGRTPGLGYTNTDGIRQKFTEKERDNETGLDYFGARYYASVQGRFTSADPLLASAMVENPQSWNRYSYTSNNPLRYVDSNGLGDWDASAGGSDTDAQLRMKQSDTSKGWFRSWGARREATRQLRFRERFRAARDEAQNAASSNLLTPDQQQQVNESVVSYGTENDQNGVTVGVRNNVAGSKASTDLKNNDTISVKFNRGLKGNDLATVVAHEGRHVGDAQAWLRNGECTSCTFNMNHFALETRGWNVSSYMAQALHSRSYGPGGGSQYQVWNRGWKQADIQTKRTRGINAILQYSGHTANGTDTYSSFHRHGAP